MTSSLVGSEMCIRDSVWRLRLWGCRCRTGRWCWRCVPARCVGRGGLRTVSYTHLTLPTICSV
eukprot:2861202-Prorocentrum_lima.AAC.1